MSSTGCSLVVHLQINALPYIEVHVKDACLSMPADEFRTWRLYTSFAPRLPGGPVQPDWAWLLSNGRDELLLSLNEGSCVLMLGNGASAASAKVTMPTAAAEQLSRSLHEQIRESGARVSSGCTVIPFPQYHASVCTLSYTERP